MGRDRAIVNSGSRNKDPRAAAVAAARGAGNLLLDEGQAVGALVDGRVAFMRADADLVERAVIGAAAVVVALGHVAFDGVVGFSFAKLIRNIPPLHKVRN